jgi:membrane protease YdiL (CAAX protease family)
MRRRPQIAALLCLGMLPLYFNGIYNARLRGTPWLFWIAEVGAWVVLPVLIVVFGARRGLFRLEDLGFHTRVFRRQSPGLLVLAIVVVGFLALPIDRPLVVWATRTVPPAPSGTAFQYEQVLPPRGPSTGGYRLLAVAYLCLSAGFVEELYYRAMFLLAVGRRWRMAPVYLVLSAAVFAGSHWEFGMTKLVYTFAWGLVMGAIYLATGNLWPVIVGHVIVDVYWLGG